MRNFLELQIWKDGHHITTNIYKVTQSYPKSEIFGLSGQMRRSSASIPTNISEGCGRNSNAEMIRFLIIATGSCSELHYQLILSKDLEYISVDEFTNLEDETIRLRKKIASFIKSLFKKEQLK